MGGTRPYGRLVQSGRLQVAAAARRALTPCDCAPVIVAAFAASRLHWWVWTVNGAVRAAEFYVDGHVLQLVGSRVATSEGGYVGAAHAGSNTVVAVSPQGVDWLSVRGDRFRLSQHQKAEIGLPTAVAVFATHRRDALVVCSRGLVMRVPMPRRGVVSRNRSDDERDF